MTLKVDRFGLGNERFAHRQIAETISNKIQQLIILPTERCNFRCTYCYEDFLIGKMKIEVQESIENYLDRRVPELSHLSLQWFGGEPLLAKQIVLRLSPYANRRCKQHGVSLTGGITTNAYVLTFDLFEELLSYEQRFFQITLDGWQEGHDAVRKLANGRRTFQQIWDNLCATKRSDEQFSIQIRIHVRRNNRESLEILVDNLAREFGGDERYTLDFEHLRNLGGPGGSTVERPLSINELREIEISLRSRFSAAAAAMSSTASVPGAPLSESQVGVAANTIPYICYAAKPNSILIRADGRLGKCTVALNDDRNTIGHISRDGTMKLNNERVRPWVRGLSDLDPNALSCPLGGLHSFQAI